MTPMRELDITAERCPMTFVKVKLALEELPTGETLRVRLNSGEPLENLPRSLEEAGFRVHPPIPDGACFLLLVEKNL